MVHKILGFTGVCRAHDQPVKRYVVSIHLYLILHRMELSVHNFQLRIADCENVAFKIFRARGLSIDLKEHTVFGFHKTDAAALHCGVRQGTQVD